MKKELLVIFYCIFCYFVFPQSQFLLDINHNRSDFHVFRSDSLPSDTIKFYNKSSAMSPVEFSNYNNEEKLVTLYCQPFSYIETKYTKSSFDISELFGEITIETYLYSYPVNTYLGDSIYIKNGSSKISFLHYSDDIYIVLLSGKITVSFYDYNLIMIAGETLVLHNNMTYDYIDDIDYSICRNLIISNIISDRQTLFDQVIKNMAECSNTATVEYRRLWVRRRFLSEY